MILYVGQGGIDGFLSSIQARVTLVVITVVVGLDLVVGFFEGLHVTLYDLVTVLLIIRIIMELLLSEFVKSGLFRHFGFWGLLLHDLVADLDELEGLGALGIKALSLQVLGSLDVLGWVGGHGAGEGCF
jgi:hypothetical protein